MPNALSQAVVMIATAIAAVALFRALRRTIRQREWSWGSLLGAMLVLFTFSYIQVVVTYLNAWIKVTDVFRVVTFAMPDWAHASLRLTIVLLAGSTFAVFLNGLRRRDAQINVPAALMVLVLFTSMAAALLHGEMPLRVFSLTYLCMLLACVFAPRGLSVQLGVAAVGVLAAMASGVALVAFKEFSVVECVAGYKCGFLGFNFHGVLDNENALALLLALAIPFVYIAFGGWEGVVMAAYLCGVILLTGSRSGALAGGVTFLAMLVIRPNIRNPQRTPVRSALLTSGLVVAFAVATILPLVVADQSKFTGRAGLWMIARGYLADPANLAYGTGLYGWENVRAAGLIDGSAVYSVHSQWLHVLFSTGLIGFTLFVAAIVILLWQARNGYYTVIGCVLVPLFILGLTERPWALDTADWLSWAAPAALLSYPLIRRRPSVETAAAGTEVAGADGTAGTDNDVAPLRRTQEVS